MREGEDLSLLDDLQGTGVDELSSSQIQVVYSESTSSEREDFISSCGSPGDEQIDITHYPLYGHAGGDIQDRFQMYSSEPSQNFSYLPKNTTDLTNTNKGSYTSHGMESAGERNVLLVGGLKTTESSRIAQNVKATLAHAALSAVLESEEKAVSPATWFDGQTEEKIHTIRRASSTGSLSDNLLHLKNEVVDGNSLLETSSLNNAQPQDTTVGSTTLAPNVRKALGHSRSKSDQIGVPNSQDQAFVVSKPKPTERRQQSSFSRVTQLSSSLPATSGKTVMCDIYTYVHVVRMYVRSMYIVHLMDRFKTNN